MRLKIVLVCAAVLGAAGLTALADPMGWNESPLFTFKGEGRGRTVDFIIEVWEDGSAVYRVVPKVDLPEEKLPTVGSIILNGKEFKFAQRETKEGKKYLFASLPVGAVPLDGNYEYTAKIYDGTGFLLVDDWGYQEVAP